jgi:hypothetical protein
MIFVVGVFPHALYSKLKIGVSSRPLPATPATARLSGQSQIKTGMHAHSRCSGA